MGHCLTVVEKSRGGLHFYIILDSGQYISPIILFWHTYIVFSGIQETIIASSAFLWALEIYKQSLENKGREGKRESIALAALFASRSIQRPS